jgi:mannose-1-phosphate guanylyltransferase
VPENCLNAIDVLVLAGGLGTRIRPVLGDTPKLLAPVAGRTFLDHLLDWLRRFGARRVVFALGHRAEAVTAHLGKAARDGLVTVPVIEPQPLGTAGAIRLARPQLHSDPVLLLNGDSFTDADICKLLARHRRTVAAGTLLCASVADAGRYGRVDIDAAGTIRGFAEKDAQARGPANISAGMYVLSAALLDTIAAGTATSLEKDVFAALPPGALTAFCECGRFIDIGTPESLAAADRFFAELSAPH